MKSIVFGLVMPVVLMSSQALAQQEANLSQITAADLCPFVASAVSIDKKQDDDLTKTVSGQLKDFAFQYGNVFNGTNSTCVLLPYIRGWFALMPNGNYLYGGELVLYTSGVPVTKLKTASGAVKDVKLTLNNVVVYSTAWNGVTSDTHEATQDMAKSLLSQFVEDWKKMH